LKDFLTLREIGNSEKFRSPAENTREREGENKQTATTTRQLKFGRGELKKG
jgi:hypothetical protein